MPGVTTATYTQDRTGEVYYSSVKPDIGLVEGDNFSDLSKDKKLAEAINWFRYPQSY